MTELIVVGFDQAEDARTALASMRTLEKEGQLHFEDTAVIERSADGKIQVKNEVSGATEGGAVVGAVIGGFVTFMFPLAGAAIGGAVGADRKSTRLNSSHL